jgi:hypothetical protein
MYSEQQKNGTLREEPGTSGWLMPVILTTWEVEIRVAAQGQSGPSW